MKALLHMLGVFALLLSPVLLFAQDIHQGQTFMDKAIWFIVPALALVVIVLMIRNRRQIANRPEEDD